MKSRNYITPSGHKRLSDELNQLLRIERPEICKLIEWAAGNGDRSENADYIYGKRRLREIDKRIRFLTGRLEVAEIVDPGKIKSHRIQFGATVTVMTENGTEKIYTIVGVDEVDTQLGHLSWQSPIGKALIGKEAGDEVHILAPNGESTLEIVSISYQSINQ